MSLPMLLALAPVVALVVAFVLYCLIDLARAPRVRYLPKVAWALVTLVSIPLGGIVYLLLGRDPGEHASGAAGEAAGR